MRLAQLFALVLAALPASGCGGYDSGQTGSPSCAAPPACVCDTLNRGGVPLRVRVESADAEHLVGSVESLVWTDTSRAMFAMVGDRIGGALVQQQPCGEPSSEAPAVGSELLVLYDPGTTGGFPNCRQFLDCAEQQCSTLPEPELSDCWDGCDAETAQVCDEQRTAALLEGTFSFAVPWSEPIDFGEGRQLPQSELDVLLTPQSCLERFPADPAPPCNDVVMEQGLGCAVAQPMPTSRANPGYWWVALGGLAWAASKRRLRKRTTDRCARPSRSC